MDGAPAAYFFVPPEPGRQNPVWHLFLDGGESCYDLESCSAFCDERRTLGDAPMPYAQRVRELYQAQQRVAERAGAARELVTIRHHSNQPAPASPTRGEVVA